MKMHTLLSFLLVLVPVFSEISYDDLSGSSASAFRYMPEVADQAIRQALDLNQNGREEEALGILRQGVQATEFKNVKVRYFLCKQYVLLMKNQSLRTKENRESLANHILFVENFLRSSEAGAEDKAYYESGMLQVKNSAREFGLEQWIPNLMARVSYAKMKEAASKAYAEYADAGAACYKTSVLTAELAGPGGTGWTWKGSTNRRYQEMAKLKEAIETQDLLPGMVVYVNYSPGTDPSSMNLANGPHWFTYLGKDSSGVDRFSDQYTDNSTLEAMIQFVPGRLIDEVFDPFASK